MATAQVKRTLAALLVLATLGAIAQAQQPLTAPNYYLFQLPGIAPGDEVSGELTETDGQNFKDGSRLDMYALAVSPGETVTLRVESADFVPVLTVFDVSGALVAFNDFGDDMGGVSTSFLADAGGRYVVVVSGWSDFDLGSYVLSSGRVRGGAETASPIDLPATLSSTIAADMAPAPGAFAGGAEYFSFDVAEELLLLASMASSDLDAALILYDADGNIVATNDDDGFTTDSLLVALLSPGSYVLAASTYFAGESGDYTLTLETFFRR